MGTSFALDRGRGAQSVPVLPALIGAVVGVIGVVSALTFAAGVRGATEHPERFGQVADLTAFVGFGGEDLLPVDEALATLASTPGVDAVNDSRQGVLESDAVDMAAYALAPVDEPLPIVVLDGAVASRPDEVVLATKTASDLDAEVGDRVELTGSRSSGDYVVSGIGFVPEGSHNGYDSGAWLPIAAYDELIEGFKFHVVDIVVDPSADVEEVQAEAGARLAALIGAPPEAGLEIVTPPPPPGRLAELSQVQRLPRLLAGFLALLAVGAVGHALDLRGSAVAATTSPSCVPSASPAARAARPCWCRRSSSPASGSTFGVPLGFVLGRSRRAIADSTPLAERAADFRVGARRLGSASAWWRPCWPRWPSQLSGLAPGGPRVADRGPGRRVLGRRPAHGLDPERRGEGSRIRRPAPPRCRDPRHLGRRRRPRSSARSIALGASKPDVRNGPDAAGPGPPSDVA